MISAQLTHVQEGLSCWEEGIAGGGGRGVLELLPSAICLLFFALFLPRGTEKKSWTDLLCVLSKENLSS